MSINILPNKFYSPAELASFQLGLYSKLQSNGASISKADTHHQGSQQEPKEAKLLQYHFENIDVPEHERYVFNESDYEVCIWDESNYDSINDAISSGANYEGRTSIPLGNSEDILSLLSLLESCIHGDINTHIAVRTENGKWLPMAIILIKG